MIINELNGKIIDTKDVYIHDDILHELIFYRLEKRLKLIIEKYEVQNEKYEIEFVNVIGFEMTACDFWGPSRRINGFSYARSDDRTIITKAFKEKKRYIDSYRLADEDSYIEIVITFISGDELRIACEKIIINDSQ